MTQGAQILPVRYDTGTQKIFVGDGDDNLPGASVVTAETNPLTGRVRNIEASGVGDVFSPQKRRIRSLLGEPIGLIGLTGLSAGSSFSGSGSYGGQGILAVQSSGSITHNPTGWADGSACLEFTPNTDSNAEFRIYIAAGVSISDSDGLAFEFSLPEMDTAKQHFSIGFDYSDSASNLYPTNTAGIDVWRCDATTATSREKAGQKYIRQRFDYAATDAACGAWPGYAPTSSGSGADRTKKAKWLRFRFGQFSGKTIKIKEVRRGGRSTPCFVIGSDNITPDTLALRGFAYAGALGLPTYVNQFVSIWDNDAALTDRIDRLYAAGVEVNGNDVVDRPLGQTVTDAATMRAAVVGTRDRLKQEGWIRGSSVWIANNNSTSYLMINELAAAGYVANRNGATDGRYVFPEGGVPDAFRIPAASFDQMNWTAIQPIIDRAIEYGCTLWIYWHGLISSAKIDEDRSANVTGTAGAPIARSGTESPSAYRARAAALGTAEGNATVVYFDARMAATALGMWWEELKPLLDYLATKRGAGACEVLGPEEWCAEVDLLPRAALVP